MDEQTKGDQMPTEAQARAMRNAVKWSSAQLGRPAMVLRYGAVHGVGLTMLHAMRRRGWVVLDDRAHPSYGTLTDAGRRALARYEASKAGAR